jgi:hypothetical protein
VLGGKRPQQHGRQIDHPHALKRSRHVRPLDWLCRDVAYRRRGRAKQMPAGLAAQNFGLAFYPTMSGTLPTTTAS